MKMRFIAFYTLLLSLSIGFCFAATSTYDGKPGCKTPTEIGQNYRNFWDPLRYWRCIGLNMEPLLESCPNGTGFQQSLNRCVSWTIWRWEPPQYPTSCPDGVMCLPPGGTQPLPSALLLPASQTPMVPHLGQSQSLQSSQTISSSLPYLGSTSQYLSTLQSALQMTPSQEAIKYPPSTQVL